MAEVTIRLAQHKTNELLISKNQITLSSLGGLLPRIGEMLWVQQSDGKALYKIKDLAYIPTNEKNPSFGCLVVIFVSKKLNKENSKDMTVLLEKTFKE